MAKKRSSIFRDEDEISPETIRRYNERLKFLRKGLEYSQANDLPRAVEAYNYYLRAITNYNQIEEGKLRPKHFDTEKDMAEILLISHVYWDLAKIYDKSPNLHIESIRCLNQFLIFSLGFKFQYINARMLRNFCRKGKAHNIKAFKDAYEKMKVESKDCFIATQLLGEQSTTTINLREFRNCLYKNRLGFIVNTYYYLSPKLIQLNYRSKSFRCFSNIIIRPSLIAISHLTHWCQSKCQ